MLGKVDWFLLNGVATHLIAEMTTFLLIWSSFLSTSLIDRVLNTPNVLCATGARPSYKSQLERPLAMSVFHVHQYQVVATDSISIQSVTVLPFSIRWHLCDRWFISLQLGAILFWRFFEVWFSLQCQFEEIFTFQQVNKYLGSSQVLEMSETGGLQGYGSAEAINKLTGECILLTLKVVHESFTLSSSIRRVYRNCSSGASASTGSFLFFLGFCWVFLIGAGNWNLLKILGNVHRVLQDVFFLSFPKLLVGFEWKIGVRHCGCGPRLCLPTRIQHRCSQLTGRGKNRNMSTEIKKKKRNELKWRMSWGDD